MKCLDFGRWLVVVLGSWLMLGNASGAVEGVGVRECRLLGKASVPWSAVGAEAGKQYSGNGLSVTSVPGGARLRCVFQRLDGTATVEGLWLISTVTNAPAERFRVRASALGRGTERLDATSLSMVRAGGQDNHVEGEAVLIRVFAPHGSVQVENNLARWVRPGLVEEYSVSVDGVRQDFVVLERPGTGIAALVLDVTGARAEQAADGARLVLDGSGRKLAYNRLKAFDAQNHELAARLEVESASRLALVVEDADAVYPVRLDPTFSDADWVSMGAVAGADDDVRACAMDGAGNLYIGGDFTVVGDIVANYVAKWNGSAWSALGSGMNGSVCALAVDSSGNLYAGGCFTTAGGVAPTASPNGTAAPGRPWARG